MFITALSRGHPVSLSSPRWFHPQLFHSRRFVWILSSHLRLGLPSRIFPNGIFTKASSWWLPHSPHSSPSYVWPPFECHWMSLFLQVSNRYNTFFFYKKLKVFCPTSWHILTSLRLAVLQVICNCLCNTPRNYILLYAGWS